MKSHCALVTGASRGLGRAFALECAKSGLDLVLASLPGDGLSELGASLARERGVRVECLEADLNEDTSLRALEALIRSKSLEVDLLVNNAGVGTVGEFLDVPIERHEAAILLNCLTLVRITRLFLELLPAGRRGQVINVASLGASFPMPTLSVYSATKSFVLSYSLALREELAGRAGVSVLCPNAIRTNAAVEDYVDEFGMLSRMACLSPERIAREALAGASRGAAVIVPGAFNRALAAVGAVVPRTLAMAAIRRFWGGFAEKPGGEGASAPKADEGGRA
jgi:short-subunit dehydrogenase